MIKINGDKVWWTIEMNVQVYKIDESDKKGDYFAI